MKLRWVDLLLIIWEMLALGTNWSSDENGQIIWKGKRSTKLFYRIESGTVIKLHFKMNWSSYEIFSLDTN